MTPAQLEHLKLIDAHLAKLLDIAAKRTPGEWGANEGQFVCAEDHGIAECYHRDSDENYHNAAFIASCAGNAEAGWKATRAAIKSLLEIEKFLSSVSDNDSTVKTATLIQEALLPHILAAFPLELVKP